MAAAIPDRSVGRLGLGGQHAVGPRLTAASGLPFTIGGFLGAHMAYARGVGVSRTAFDEQIVDWTRLDVPTPLHEGWGEASAEGGGREPIRMHPPQTAELVAAARALAGGDAV